MYGVVFQILPDLLFISMKFIVFIKLRANTYIEFKTVETDQHPKIMFIFQFLPLQL
jgi:hypothetical protein